MSNPCYSAGVNHIPDSSAPGVRLVSVSVPTARSDAATVNGSAVDRSGLQHATVLVQVGVTSGTPDSFTVDAKLQHCDTSTGTFADVPGASITQITAASSSGQASFDLAGAKQFVRVVQTVALVGGTAPTVTVAASLLLSP